MKLATILLALQLAAAPITFTSEGYINPIDGGFFFNLVNSNFYGNRQAFLMPSTPVGTLVLDLDNTPHQPGTGLCIATAQQDFGCYGSGQAFTGQVTVAHSDGSLIDRLILYTLAPFGWFRMERGTLSVRSDTPVVQVPEMSAMGELGLAVFALIALIAFLRGATKKRMPNPWE